MSARRSTWGNCGGLFGGHVVEAAEHGAGVSQTAVPRMAGEAEIEQFRLAFRRQQNVRRLDVAVNELVLMHSAREALAI